MTTEGKILQQGTCHFCKVEYIVVQPTGGEVKVMHKEPLCDVFNNSSGEDFMKFHTLNRRGRRAAEARMRRRRA